MKFFLLCFCCLYIFPPLLYANSPIDNKTVSFTEFINEMANAKEKTTFENVKIRYVLSIDKPGMDKRFNEGAYELYVKQDIRLLNCDFDLDYWLVLRNITFMEYFAVFSSSPIKAIFKYCTFKKTPRWYTDQIEFLEFDTCNFEHGFKFVRNSLKDHMIFTGCKFSVNEKLLFDTDALDMEARIFLLSNKLDNIDLTIENCEFNVPDKFWNDPQYFIKLNASNFSNIRFLNNKVNTSIDFSQSNVSNMFMTYECEFNGKILMDAFSINPLNTRVQWSSVKGNKISVFDTKNKQIFNGDYADSMKNEFLYNSLASCYSTFYGAFKTQGNKIAANACYVEWKDLETQYFKNTYKQSSDRKVYFNYIINLFLKFFCDYATNPLKAIQIALYVLLGFGLIYSLFPYRLKTFQKRTVFEQLRLYGHYLSSPKSLLEIEDAEFIKDTEPKSYQHYTGFLKGSDKKLPWYFHVFAKPLYYLERMKNTPVKVFYKIIDQFPDEWQSMPKSKKILANVLYGFVFLFTVLWFLTIHILDSIMLSLNVFSTLGFGLIPVRGLPRYLTVIEGFIGWFLLSIFSVSLISQVLQ